MENPLIFLKIFLFFINYTYSRQIYFISFSTFCFLTNVLQVVDVEILFLLYIKILLYCFGDIEINPLPKQSSKTFCHWNLMGLLLINLSKFHYYRDMFDIIRLSETFINFFLESEDDGLKTEGYT